MWAHSKQLKHASFDDQPSLYAQDGLVKSMKTSRRSSNSWHEKQQREMVEWVYLHSPIQTRKEKHTQSCLINLEEQSVVKSSGGRRNTNWDVSITSEQQQQTWQAFVEPTTVKAYGSGRLHNAAEHHGKQHIHQRDIRHLSNSVMDIISMSVK